MRRKISIRAYFLWRSFAIYCVLFQYIEINQILFYSFQIHDIMIYEGNFS